MRRRSDRRESRLVPLALCLSLVATALGWSAVTAGPASATSSVSVSVVGNHLVNAAGQTVRLFGVDRSGTEYACEQGWGIFDGPSEAPSVAAMAGWHINAVRIPLNEGCWLDKFTSANDPNALYGNPAPYEGAAYKSAVGAYVSLLHSYGIAAIITLNGLDAPDGLSVPPMADSKYSPTFWGSVASYFKHDPGVIFDLYNEPNAITWPCWESGCSVATDAGTYQAAGMQQLVNAVRSRGATQPLMLGGLDYSSDASSWLSYLPTDPDHSLVLSFHTYNSTNCNTRSCWESTIEPLAAVVPVVTGEFGEYDCATSYSDAYMQFADSVGISYLGWAWDAISPGGWQCNGPSLITNYDGTPSPEGVALQSHLLTLFDDGLVSTFPPPAPAITKVSPASGAGGGGTKVTIRGDDFTGASGASAVLFGSTPAASYTVNAAGSVITAYSPPGAAGSVTISVTTPGGTTDSSTPFTYLPPKITKITPASGVAGTLVTISGTNLVGAGAVSFGGITVVPTVISSTSITAVAPIGAGTVEITVTTPGGTSVPSTAHHFTYT